MDIQDHLRTFQQPWTPGFDSRVAALPAPWATLIGAHVKGGRDHQERQRLQDELTDALHASTPADREALAAALFPQVPALAARTLDALLTRHPYPLGYARRAFRAPGHRLAAAHAAHWLWQAWHTTRDYPQPASWFAVHAGLLNPWESQGLGLLLGQAISDGDEEIYQILRDTAGTQHPVARMGRHVPLALLSSTREDAWTLAEGLLLAAQRQEGLRQVILETVDEASADAFTRTLRLILQEDLLRFAATLRAACVWFGLNYDVTDLKVVRAHLSRALTFLEEPEAARRAVQGGEGVDAYLALFTLGMRDAVQAAELARTVLTDADPARRMAAAQFLTAAELLTDDDRRTLLTDDDLRLAALAGSAVSRWGSPQPLFTFEEFEAYALRLPDRARHDPLLFPWLGHVPARADALDALPALRGERPFTALIPHLSGLSAYGKTALLRSLKDHAAAHPLDAPTRTLLLTLLQDRNSSVSQEAVTVMAHFTPDPAEVEVVHTLLKRKSGDLRRGLIRLLAGDPAQAQRSAAALLSGPNTEQRQAGLQLLIEIGGTPPADFSAKNVTEATLLSRLTEPAAQLTLADGLGLFDPTRLSRPEAPQPRERDYPADVARGAALLRDLDALLVANRETPLTGPGWDGQETQLLGNVRPWQLRPGRSGQPMPLWDVWTGWWQGREDAQDGDLTRLHWALNHFVNRTQTTEAELQDELDGNGAQPAAPDTAALDAAELDAAELDAAVLDLLGLDQEGLDDLLADADEDDLAEHQAARSAAEIRQDLLRRTLHRTLGPLVTLRLEHPDLARVIVNALHAAHATPLDTDLALDAWETALAYLPRDVQMQTDPLRSWWQEDPRNLLNPVMPQGDWRAWTPAQQRRFWALHLHRGAGYPNLPRQRVNTPLLLHAHAQGWATGDDLLDQLIGPRPERGRHYYGHDFGDLSTYTRRTLKPEWPTHPDWEAAVKRVRDRVLEVELARGGGGFQVTAPALALSSLHGADLTLRLLAGLGKNPLKRGYQGHNESRDVTFSHLIRVAFPLSTDTPDAFRTQAAALGLPDGRLLDLAMFAPQWAPLVAGALGWRGLKDGVYWLHAHTRDSNWSVPQDVRDAWEAEIGERTPLNPADLTEGAVDVAWFRQTFKALGGSRFSALLDAAKYASSSGGHKRAETYARAILGELNEGDLTDRITEKRNQDAVRALGLLPLARAKGKAARELEGRYRLISDFRIGARQFGAQRQASERRAADIGLLNLARSAGYADPQRLMWAMEARTAPDWTAAVTDGDLHVGIHLSADGEASLTVTRGDKPLKALPPALKKRPDVQALQAAAKELGATRKRMRAALEETMIRGDHLQPQELTDLAAHPVIAPMLRSLVWVMNETHLGWWTGDTLDTPGGPQSIGEHALRLAHPHDLFTSGHWPTFQAQVMDRHVTQPFKQVFREYYPLTAPERDARRVTRYADQHVQPGKAAALLKTRGWITVPEEGVRKTWHAEGINVWLDTSVGSGTPNEVEGTPVNAAYFIRRDATEPLPLSEVPPRLLSETLRDLDLIVSVAHVGGVDPEATQSTTGMRAALLRETLRLLKLGNVRIQNDHALIEGHHARYTLHLGSGTVHRQPGGYLCIIPVHNGHQGRLFLPFADPDPRTAEVISKALLLAQDRQIQDPTILEQLR